MKYRYFICDVFTPRPFSGNQLAVLPEAEGLNEVQMQQIAREFNFSETAFVFPPEQGQTRRVRIFTPTSELPFAGHPNLGTAFSLTSTVTLEKSRIPSGSFLKKKQDGFLFPSIWQRMEIGFLNWNHRKRFPLGRNCLWNRFVRL